MIFFANAIYEQGGAALLDMVKTAAAPVSSDELDNIVPELKKNWVLLINKFT